MKILQYFKTLGRDFLVAFKHRPQLFILLLFAISAGTFGFTLSSHWDTQRIVVLNPANPPQLFLDNDTLIRSVSFFAFAIFIIVVLNCTFAITFSKTPTLKLSILMTVVSLMAVLVMVFYIRAYNVFTELYDVIDISPPAGVDAHPLEIIRHTRNIIILHTVINVAATLGSYLLSIGNLFGQKDNEYDRV